MPNWEITKLRSRQQPEHWNLRKRREIRSYPRRSNYGSNFIASRSLIENRRDDPESLKPRRFATARRDCAGAPPVSRFVKSKWMSPWLLGVLIALLTLAVY